MFDPHIANAGFWIVRNSGFAREVLTWWYTLPDWHEKCGKYSAEWPWEQGAFNTVVLGQHREHIVLAPPRLFSTPQSLVVSHLWVKDPARTPWDVQKLALQRLRSLVVARQEAVLRELG
mmetsp:Transcript_112087/g.256891  ORF Transcript_112087/g.256891 Transcript_112087/m.256891 type:complete len:119 (+) Transcript_112087:2-358(+)